MYVHNYDSQSGFDAVFLALENEKEESITNQSMALKSVFKQPVQLASAMEVYKIHRAIMRITLVVAKQLVHLKEEWEGFLKLLNGYECMVKDSYPISIDTSTAISVLKDEIPRVDCVLLNLEDAKSRQEFVEFLIEMDAYTFRENHSQQFLDKMLQPKEARAFIAHHNQRIVGGLWGFFTEYEDKKIFHAWLLVIRPDFSSLGIGKRLIELAKQESQNYPDVELATLNVDHFNKHAQVLYDKEEFVSFSDQTDKNFMGRSLVQREDQIKLSETTAKNIVKDYVMKNASVFKLAMWEMARQSGLLRSKILWSCKNPHYETLTLDNAL